MSESFTAVLYADTVRGWAKVMATAAVIQNTAGRTRAANPWQSGWWPTELDGHPVQWPRPEMDDMLNTPEQVIVPAGSGPSAFAGPWWNAWTQWRCRFGLFIREVHQSFTVEVEYSSDVPAAMAYRPRSTSRDGPGFQVSTEEVTPEFWQWSTCPLEVARDLRRRGRKHWRRRTS